MKAFLASALVAILLCACGGGGGNPGTCSGSAQYCAEFASQPGSAGTGTPPPGVQQLFTKSGTGDALFNLPADVTLIRIQATYAGPSHNFLVKFAGQLMLNEIIGTSLTPPGFDGTYLVSPGESVEITGSAGVDWTVTQVLPEPASTAGGPFARSGTGDMVFELPARVRKLHIQATYPGLAKSFIVLVARTAVVNTLLGSAENPATYDAVVTIAGGGTVEIINSNGVSWSIQEVP